MQIIIFKKLICNSCNLIANKFVFFMFPLEIKPIMATPTLSKLSQKGSTSKPAKCTSPGDALEIEWPAGAGLRQAPKAPASSSFSDYVVLLDARPLSEAQPKATKNVKYVEKALDDSMGPSAQKAAYGVPASLKGVSKGNSQMVFGRLVGEPSMIQISISIILKDKL